MEITAWRCRYCNHTSGFEKNKYCSMCGGSRDHSKNTSNWLRNSERKGLIRRKVGLI